MGKTVKVSDSVTVDFTKVEYPPDVFVRKLDRCAVTTTYSLKCGVESRADVETMIIAPHRLAMDKHVTTLEKYFTQVVKKAWDDSKTTDKSEKKIQAEAGAKIHEKVSSKAIKKAVFDEICLNVGKAASKTMRDTFDLSWLKSASLDVDIKNLQHKKDVLRFIDPKKYVKHNYKFDIGSKIRYDATLFGPNIGKIKLDAKLVAKAVTDPRTDGEILGKAVDLAFADEMKSVVKQINKAMVDAEKLVKAARSDKEKAKAVAMTETLVKGYLASIQANVSTGISERVYQLAKTMGSRRTAKILNGLSISLSIVGLAASITLMIVPIGGIGGAVTAAALIKTIFSSVKSLVSAYNDLQKLHKDATKELKKLLKALDKMLAEYKKNGPKLETQRDKVIDGLLVCWDDVVGALDGFRLAISTFVQKATDLEQEIQKIIKKGEKANEKIVAEFMKDIPNEDQMRKDLDKLHKILEPVITKDKERKQAVDRAGAGLEACKQAYDIEKTMRKQLKASKTELRVLGALGKVIMTQVPNLKTMFSSESTNMQKLGEVLKVAALPLKAL